MIKITREITCDYCCTKFYNDTWELNSWDVLPATPTRNKISGNDACDKCIKIATEAAIEAWREST
jgi:hypothetical protein